MTINYFLCNQANHGCQNVNIFLFVQNMVLTRNAGKELGIKLNLSQTKSYCITYHAINYV